jgi:hypothetical protein
MERKLTSWVVQVAATGVLAVGAAVASSAIAAADPPPADPAIPVADQAPPPPPPGPEMGTMGPLGATPSAYGIDVLLSQHPAPAAPGQDQPAAPLPMAVLNDGQFLNPNNYRVPPADQDSPYALAQGEPGPFARVDGLKGLHAMLQGAMGRMPLDQLSEPLPGTAPAPDVRIPAGPEQNLPDPAAPVPALGLPAPAADLVAPPIG